MIRPRGLDTTPGGGGGWFVVKMANGSVGIQRLNPGQKFTGRVVKAVYIAPRTVGIQGILGNGTYDQALTRAIGTGPGGVGANTYQQNTLINQLDRGAGQDNSLSILTVGRGKLPRNRPNISSNVSTQGRSEAVSAGIPVPNFSAVTDFLDFMSWLVHPLNWLRMVEFLAGLLFFYLGLRETFGLRGRPPRGPVSFVYRRIARSPERQGRRAARRQARFDKGYMSERERQRNS